MEPAASGQAKFDGGKRLVAIIAQAVDGIDVNGGLRAGQEVNLNFLLLNRVAGPERRRASGRVNAGGEHGQREEKTRAGDRRQGVSDCS